MTQRAASSSHGGGDDTKLPSWPGSRSGWATHQNEAVHDVLTKLQASGTCDFQKQVACGFLNLKS